MEEQNHPVPCPTCGTLCNITWSGLDLVENTGDETLATKNYTPDGGLQEMYDEVREENQRLREQLDEQLSREFKIEGGSDRINAMVLAISQERQRLREIVEDWRRKYAGFRPDTDYQLGIKDGKTAFCDVLLTLLAEQPTTK